ncbi:glycosyltransferase family 4 protein [Microbulbifer salipaludis]|uniref:Glycosyltransferase family 4 protein n=1 Tax=Microbulbifer salipaludis TaxID=187980 RepID=A0ABS3E2F9_9GAMM|nr:glycosyltransferase family 4 protein [Microbulbifer salipaludis]MBN8429462.1 glycosyltransferase family 4 protein [Microbulbifer salipaludis]
MREKKVLLIIESCNPELSSVPLVGYNFYKAIKRFSNVHLVTHCRNRGALTRCGVLSNVTYYEQTTFEILYYKFICFLSTYRGQVIWPIRHALQFPIYFFFDKFVHKKFASSVGKGEFDIVHALTPILPRFPYKISHSCKDGAVKTPFIIGPVNGGVPYPKGFKDVARREFSYLNFIRKIGKWLVPGYRKTYERADVILSGSTYTLNFIKKIFPHTSDRIKLMYENGVSDSFFRDDALYTTRRRGPTLADGDAGHENGHTSDKFQLLFLGRIEPYKGCDMIVDALGQLTAVERSLLKLIIVGEGSQRFELEKLVAKYGLEEVVEFKGWIDHSEVSSEYASADLFCFPSLREFGGAVVMEAMASGLPCVVVDNGGIGEYVTETTGVKIKPHDRAYVVQKLKDIILSFSSRTENYEKMRAAAARRARTFSWDNKSLELEAIYSGVLVGSSGKTGELISSV